MRTALGTGIGLWLLEISAGTIGFLWPNLSGGFGGKLTIGTLERSRSRTPACRSPRASRPTSRSPARS